MSINIYDLNNIIKCWNLKYFIKLDKNVYESKLMKTEAFKCSKNINMKL